MQFQQIRASLAHHSGLSAFASAPLLACRLFLHFTFNFVQVPTPQARVAIAAVDTSARQSLMTVALNYKTSGSVSGLPSTSHVLPCSCQPELVC